MLHVNLTFVVFLFFCTNCTCSICKFTRCWCIARANRAENKRHCKSLVYKKHHPNRNLKNIRVFSILANYLFNQGIYGKSCSMFHLFKKKALSQILAFHPYSMIVSCLFCSSEVWCLQKLRNQWIITGLAKVINFLGAYLGFYQIIINK